MLRAYIIDDDPPSLKIVGYFLRDYQAVEVVGTFTNPLEALTRFEQDKPQLIFLDINMAPMNGMELANKLLDISPGTDIIFTTAYDHFAVSAFELNASDYLVKPIMKERFDKSMERIIKKHGRTADIQDTLSIRCFGKFSIFFNKLEPIKWRTEKSKELAALLMYHAGREVSRDEIIEQLWPETDADRAIHYLHNSIYYIRKSFEEYGISGAVMKISGTYTFTVSDEVDSDLDRFRTLTAIESKDSAAMESLLSICRAGFMVGEDWNWASLERGAIEEKYLNLVVKLSAQYLKSKDFTKAEELLKEAYTRAPFDERITTLLIKLYISANQKIKAMMHFNEYTELIRDELGIHPGKFIKDLIATIK